MHQLDLQPDRELSASVSWNLEGICQQSDWQQGDWHFGALAGSVQQSAWQQGVHGMQTKSI